MYTHHDGDVKEELKLIEDNWFIPPTTSHKFITRNLHNMRRIFCVQFQTVRDANLNIIIFLRTVSLCVRTPSVFQIINRVEIK